jgi:carboxypeptidase C (cathepsin A)
LNIPEYAPDWDMCADIDYSENEIGSQWVWEQLKGKYRMLKFSGDMDGCVPTIGTLNWINAMGRDILEPYRPWYTGDQVAGYIEEQDGLTFISVHGAGHMVP